MGIFSWLKRTTSQSVKDHRVRPILKAPEANKPLFAPPAHLPASALPASQAAEVTKPLFASSAPKSDQGAGDQVLKVAEINKGLLAAPHIKRWLESRVFRESGAAMRVKLVQTPMGLYTKDLLPFLERLARIFQRGFGPAEIARVMELTQLPVGSADQVEFSVVFAGAPLPLGIRVHMSAVDSPDLNFFSSALLVIQIDREFDRYRNELGR
jgi:hypothetical protein